ncbi:MAG: insulinase family protein [Bacteroidales bacterium]|nr:insulinase family protein [Bacteroidales bacterium]
MKRLLLSLVIVLSVNVMSAQVKVKTTKLDNGLKVVMCEDHSSPQAYGAVYVHAGSKNDPLEATGMAHYFEHIMFKGTDKIGTINWEAEKVYLDSIDMMYDKLHETTDLNERAAIQKKINELSIASTEYAIPNEVDVILTKMGGEGLNAGTAYDQTMYFNSFPANQIGKWMDVYAERFRYPVFRLFQSELETVYEEKNMYGDGPINAFQEYMFQEIFGEHPYGRPVIGLTEHLKNPQTTKMREFFNTYYVANNMTLILVGDFNIEEIEPMVAEKFGSWRSGEIPAQPEFTLPEFKGQTLREVRMTPIKIGALAWKGVKISDPDYLPLSIACSIFSNGETGIMDKDMLDGNIMMAMLMPLSLEDHGANIILYIPKLIGQSHEKAEAFVFASLDKLKKGEFSDDLFEAIRVNMLKERELELESLGSLANLFLELEMRGMTYYEYLAESERIKSITKEEIVKIANKYFGEDYLDIRSKMGFPEKDKVDKPNWKAIEAKNTDAKSEFAKMIEAEEIPEVKPQVVDFQKDVTINKINDCFTMISAKNPYNDIFNLTITHNYGTIDDPDLNRAISYFEMQGTENKSFEELSLELQKLGAMIYISASQSNTNIVIEGFEKDLDQILALCEEKIYKPANDEKKIGIIYENESMNEETVKEDASEWASAVRQYSLYGEKSSYLAETPLKQWKKRSGAELLREVDNALNYNGEVLFIGNIDNQEVINALKKHNLVKDNVVKSEKSFLTEKTYTDNQIFIAHNKKFRQSNIYMHVPSELLNKEEKAVAMVFNKYFGTDMYSIVFQEVREFRSLGYTAYGYFMSDYLNRKPSFLFTYLGTQSDKTNEGIDVLRGLITDMPERLEKFNASKDALIMSRASDYVGFRSLPAQVSTWLEEGYDHDPRMEYTNLIKKTEYKDVDDFYKKFVADRPIVIMMSGNKKQIDVKALEKYGTVKELKYKEIFR